MTESRVRACLVTCSELARLEYASHALCSKMRSILQFRERCEGSSGALLGIPTMVRLYQVIEFALGLTWYRIQAVVWCSQSSIRSRILYAVTKKE